MLLHTCAVPHKPACLLCSLPVSSGLYRFYVQYGEVSGDLTVSTYGVLIVHCLHRAALLGVPDLDLRGNRLQ